MKQVIESGYPISFRQDEAKELGKHIKHGDSVVLIGMKRVGISNFLRFFLYNDHVVKTYINNGNKHLFVHVDLNDLVERNILPFWTLLLTRVVDSMQNSDLPESVKRQGRKLFVQSIQLKDLFFTLDSLQKLLGLIVSGGLYPTLFLLRFDRLQDVITPEFFSNLHGLRDAAKHKLSYVFTSYRPLQDLSPTVFKKPLLSTFASDMYLPPAKAADMEIVLQTLEGRYHETFNGGLREPLLSLSGGYVQYLQLAIVRLRQEKKLPKNALELFTMLAHDEQIQFQSEELYESLTKQEKEALAMIKQGQRVDGATKEKAAYLWNTGIASGDAKKPKLFSALFDDYLTKVTGSPVSTKEFTKKEHLLFSFLKSHEGELCEREAIIESVWPEEKDLGVSDWAIDRLVARLRAKLKTTKSPYQIITVVTRGYKLISS